MMNERFLRIASGGCIVLAVLAAGCEPVEPKDTAVPDADAAQAETDADAETDYAEKVKELYEATKETTGEMSKEVIDWTKEDISNIGAWEYKIVTFGDIASEEIEKELNALGAERWDCFWVQETEAGPRFYLKKPKRSYLKLVPAGNILKLVPKAAGGSDE